MFPVCSWSFSPQPPPTLFSLLPLHRTECLQTSPGKTVPPMKFPFQSICVLFPKPSRSLKDQQSLPLWTGAGIVDLAAGFGHVGSESGCGSSEGAEMGLQQVDFYLCPGDHPHTTCRGSYKFFCPSWSCLTLTTYPGGPTWSPILSIARTSRPELCTMGACNPITMTVHNPNSVQWYYSITLGLRLYIGGFDLGTMFTIQKRVLIPWSPPKPIGPLTDLGDPMFHPHPDKVSPTGPTAPLPVQAPQLRLQPQHLQPSLMSVLGGVHHLLNITQPKLAQDCWLCLKAKPPYYVGLGVEVKLKPGPLSCRACPHSVTLGDVSGNASCLVS
ncbi:endogenous retrovirus group S71 member 1 Env polyprotein-like [Sapajus apella]|uniref:Endogenous retrovirus group S71 member 1 Env polyprotein-like n=1 Tax=Sapajus apella TaxID=9515 RepID=A0A6J3H3T5_SAPAP|nr:endogenous retrovirus group S71 member 1 Env polyprotein-like [Sapajus apella]